MGCERMADLTATSSRHPACSPGPGPTRRTTAADTCGKHDVNAMIGLALHPLQDAFARPHACSSIRRSTEQSACAGKQGCGLSTAASAINDLLDKGVLVRTRMAAASVQSPNGSTSRSSASELASLPATTATKDDARQLASDAQMRPCSSKTNRGALVNPLLHAHGLLLALLLERLGRPAERRHGLVLWLLRRLVCLLPQARHSLLQTVAGEHLKGGTAAVESSFSFCRRAPQPRFHLRFRASYHFA